MTANLLHSLRAKREEEQVIAENPKQTDISKVGSRISNKFKNLYSTDDEDNALFYQPTRKAKNADRRSVLIKGLADQSSHLWFM